MTDLFTKWTIATPLPNQSAPSVAKVLMDTIYRYGPPKQFLTDQGREFVNKLNTEIMDLFGIKQTVTSAYHPQTNGQDERTNRTIKQSLAKYINSDQNDWDKYLLPISYAINTSKQASTKFTPFYLMYGRNPHAPTSLNAATDDEVMEFLPSLTPTDITDRRISEMADVQGKVLANIKKAQKAQKKYFEEKAAKGVKSFTFKVGQNVLRRNARRDGRKGDRLKFVWKGPYKIVSISPKGLATLEDTAGVTLRTSVNVSQLKPAIVAEPSDSEISPAVEDENDDCLVTTVEPVPKRRKLNTFWPAQKCVQENLFTAINNNEWLEDTHINHGQALLQAQFPDRQGFQATGVFIAGSAGATVGTPSSEFVQILNINGNHWICVSTIGLPAGSCNVYDSLGPSKPSPELLKYISWMLFHQGATLTVRCVSIQRQSNGSDCGVFSLATATALCFGIPPETCSWDHSKMRGHLTMCYREGVMSPFPQQSKQRRQSSAKIFTFELHCICRQPHLPNDKSCDPMAMCSKCNVWFHKTCDTIPTVVFEDVAAEFVCSQCS